MHQFSLMIKTSAQDLMGVDFNLDIIDEDVQSLFLSQTFNFFHLKINQTHTNSETYSWKFRVHSWKFRNGCRTFFSEFLVTGCLLHQLSVTEFSDTFCHSIHPRWQNFSCQNYNSIFLIDHPDGRLGNIFIIAIVLSSLWLGHIATLILTQQVILYMSQLPWHQVSMYLL